jgi:hypothetical protein
MLAQIQVASLNRGNPKRRPIVLAADKLVSVAFNQCKYKKNNCIFHKALVVIATFKLVKVYFQIKTVSLLLYSISLLILD